MSSKGTIFLTSTNEHVYDETNDWSIVLEINKESINYCEYVTYNNIGRREIKILNLEEIKYIVIQTKENYRFSNLFKRHYSALNNWCVKSSKGNILYLSNNEFQSVETDKENIKCFAIVIEINKKSEWFEMYKKKIISALNEDKKEIDNKLEELLTIEEETL